jgi:cell division protein FtsN
VRHAGPVSGQWAIQVGAYSNATQAHAALGSARQHARGALADARSNVSTVHQARHVLYRARMTGLSRDAAVQACERLARGRNGCIVLSPDSQS